MNSDSKSNSNGSSNSNGVQFDQDNTNGGWAVHFSKVDNPQRCAEVVAEAIKNLPY